MREYHDVAENRFHDEIKVDIFHIKEKQLRTVTWENVGTFDFETTEEALAFFATVKTIKSYHIERRRADDSNVNNG